VMKALLFPGIKLLWLGTFIMVGGFLISLWRLLSKRRKEKRTVESA